MISFLNKYLLAFAFITLAFVVFQNCTDSNLNSSIAANENAAPYSLQSNFTTQYAKGFAIGVDSNTGYRTLQLFNPFDGFKPFKKYLLVPKSIGTFESTDFDGEIIRVPVQKIGIFSSSFIGLLAPLNALDNIALVEKKQYIYNSQVLANLQKGATEELGELPAINVEKLLVSNPEVVFLSGLDASLNKVLEKPQEYGIKMIHNFDWMEMHPLARAEWIKFFGAFLGKEQLADSLFAAVATRYLTYEKEAVQFTNSPKVLFASLYAGTWYFPGGKSYISTLTQHANGTHPWMQNDNPGSLPLNYEAVAVNCLDAAIWINPDVSSKAELLERDSRYAHFFEDKPNFLGIFQNNKRSIATGGNDYYEQGSFRVDLVLRDMIILLHPEWMSKDSLYFYQELH